MTFAWPWALLGLSALPALAAIYWLRRRSRRLPVSSLLLWRDATSSRAAGRRFERFESSRLLLLELLIVALLVIAAAGPRLPRRHTRRPLVVVLDDSFSMRAGSPSSRQAASEALLRELEDRRHGAVTLVTAGERPRVLGEGLPGGEEPGEGEPGEASSSPDAVAARLERWRASSAAARLEPAIALAAQLGGGRARLLVLSDRAPPEPPPPVGRLAWWAFGRSVPNLALVGAMRRPEGRGEAAGGCLVEVANYSPWAAVAELSATVGAGPPAELSRLELAAGEVGRVRFSVPRGEQVRLRLSGDGVGGDGVGDALGIDDRAILLAERQRAVRVALAIGDEQLRESIRGVLAACERALFSPERADLVIADGPETDGEPPAAWRLRLLAGGPAEAYLGPFVLDRSHPLTAGLELEGVIWGAARGAGASAGASASVPRDPLGTPVIIAGDVVLLADREIAGGGRAPGAPYRSRHLTMFWRPDSSTVQRTPNWPILWWNLLEWRARSVPGVRAMNLRLGGEASIGTASADGSAELELPDGSRRRLTALSGRLAVPAEQPGIYRLHHGGRVDRWAVNALAAEESDLRSAESGRWGGWRDDDEARRAHRGVGWVLLLLASAGQVLHLYWTGPRR